MKSIEIKGRAYEKCLCVAEVLVEFVLSAALFNRGFVSHDYHGGLPKSFKFNHLPEDYEKATRMLMN